MASLGWRIGQPFNRAYQATQFRLIFGCRYPHHRSRSGLFFDSPNGFPSTRSGTEERTRNRKPHENRCCCSCCLGCSCCDWPIGSSSDCCSTNHRAAAGSACPVFYLFPQVMVIVPETGVYRGWFVSIARYLPALNGQTSFAKIESVERGKYRRIDTPDQDAAVFVWLAASSQFGLEFALEAPETPEMSHPAGFQTVDSSRDGSSTVGLPDRTQSAVGPPPEMATHH